MELYITYPSDDPQGAKVRNFSLPSHPIPSDLEYTSK